MPTNPASRRGFFLGYPLPPVFLPVFEGQCVVATGKGPRLVDRLPIAPAAFGDAGLHPHKNPALVREQGFHGSHSIRPVGAAD